MRRASEAEAFPALARSRQMIGGLLKSFFHVVGREHVPLIRSTYEGKN